MGHSLKIKCGDSRVKVHILASTSVPYILTMMQVAKFFCTNSHETDNSVHCTKLQIVVIRTSVFWLAHIFRIPYKVQIWRVNPIDNFFTTPRLRLYPAKSHSKNSGQIGKLCATTY